MNSIFLLVLLCIVANLAQALNEWPIIGMKKKNPKRVLNINFKLTLLQ